MEEESAPPAEEAPPAAEASEEASQAAEVSVDAQPDDLSVSQAEPDRASAVSKHSQVALEKAEEKKSALEISASKAEVHGQKVEEDARKGEERKRVERQSKLSVISEAMGISPSAEALSRRHSDRPSKVRTTIGSVISIRKQSVYGDTIGGVKISKYMNTYKLDPDHPFHIEKVEIMLKEVLIEAIEELVYDVEKCPKQAKWASALIRSRLKEQEYDRYKFIVLVTIGEKRNHDMCYMARFLWDIDRDKCASCYHENMYVFAAALAFGIYYECGSSNYSRSTHATSILRNSWKVQTSRATSAPYMVFLGDWTRMALQKFICTRPDIAENGSGHFQDRCNSLAGKTR